MMNKKILIFIAIGIFCLFGAITVGASQKAPKETASLDLLAGSIDDSIIALIGDTNISPLSYSEIQGENRENMIVGQILGRPISKAYFALRVNLYKVCNSSNPLDEAWESLKKETVAIDFAQKKNLIPSEDEIKSAVEAERELIYSDEDSKIGLYYLLNQIGLTEDEYWEVYKTEYETPVNLIKTKVNIYLLENNLPELDYSQVEAEITDEEFFDSLK